MPRKPTPGGQDDEGARFRGETVERRLLLSAAWITGTAGDDIIFGTAGDDCIQGMAGDDTIYAGAGDDLIRAAYDDDVLWGDVGFDVVDYSFAGSAVTVDLTDTSAQSTGGGGVDELHGMEGVVGSDYADTFSFANPVDGTRYSVDGGLGTDIVDLSSWNLSDVTFGDGTVDVDTGTGTFTVDFANVDTIALGDEIITVLGGAGDLAVSGHDASSVWLSHGQLFEVEQLGNGDVDFSYDGASNTVTVTGFNGTNVGSVLRILDLNGGGLAVDSVTVDRAAGTLVSDADIGTITMVGGTHFDVVDVGGGAGSIDSVVGDDWNSDIAINADVGSITADNLYGAGGGKITVNGDVGSLSVTGQISAALEIFGDLDDLSATSVNQAVTVHGDMDSFTAAGDVTNVVSVEGKLGSFSADRLTNAVLVMGDLDSFSVSGVMSGTLTAERVIGPFDLYGPAGYEAHQTYATMTQVVWNGSTVGETAVPNSAPVATATGAAVVVDTSLVLSPSGTDPDAFDTIQAIRIESLPTDGVLRFGGAPVSVNDVFTAAQIESGLLTFDASGAAVGTFSFDFSVSDGELWSASAATLAIDVMPTIVDSAPLADAGVDQVVSEGDLVTLDATGSTDPEAMPLSYTWAQVSGPPVVLSDPTAAQPTFVAPEGLSSAVAVFQLIASDGTTSSIDTVAVTINADDDAPTASAGTDQLVNEGELVTLDATGSTDPEGRPLTYSWVQTSGPVVTLSNASSSTPTFVAPQGLAAAVATFELTVSDGTNSSVATVNVSIRAINDAPIAVAGPSQTVGEGEVVTLDASRSSDPESQRLSYSWRQVGGPAVRLSDPTDVRPTFSAPELIGEVDLTFELTVSDGTNRSVDSVTVTIQGDNDAPIVSTGAAQNVDAGELVTLSAQAQDVEGDRLSFSWMQLSGTPVSLTGAQTASPTFAAPSVTETTNLVFRVTVSDGTNLSVATAMVTIFATEDADSGETVSTPNTVYQAPEPTVTPVPIAGEPGTTTGSTERTRVPGGGQSGSEPTFAADDDTDPGSGSAARDPVESVRTIEAGADQVAPEGSTVRLDAELTGFSSRGVKVEWQQIAGLPVILNHASTLDPTFVAPNSGADYEVVFRVTASDGSGHATDTVTVKVLAADDPLTVEPVNVIVGDAGSAVQLQATVDDPEAGDISFVWTQVAGTEVKISQTDTRTPTVELPEVFVEEELVFQVAVRSGADEVTEEVTVRVQPVDSTQRESLVLSSDDTQVAAVTDEQQPHESRGIGKIWAALLALARTRPSHWNA